MSTPEFELDAQSRAFRENTDHVSAVEIDDLAEQVHSSLTSLGPILLPEDYEALHWDAGRIEPKSLDEAREALAARIADPLAPDLPSHTSAYDDMEG